MERSQDSMTFVSCFASNYAKDSTISQHGVSYPSESLETSATMV